jgi:hypothetical protein
MIAGRVASAMFIGDGQRLSPSSVLALQSISGFTIVLLSGEPRACGPLGFFIDRFLAPGVVIAISRR